MADNLHRQFDHIEDFETERPQTTNYQDYQALNNNSIKLQDMIFFWTYLKLLCVNSPSCLPFLGSTGGYLLGLLLGNYHQRHWSDRHLCPNRIL